VLYEEALVGAQDILHIIEPYSKRVEICGSLRRKRPEVHDIDIVCQDTDRFSMITSLAKLCEKVDPTPAKIRFVYRGMQGEIYFVKSEQEFEVLKLERTGDFEFVRSMSKLAIEHGYVFRFSVDQGYYKIPMFGLYKIGGKYFTGSGPNKQRHYYVNDMRHPICYKEADIIWLIYGREIPPESRNWYSGSTVEATQREDSNVL
jgi:hypothetical protein